MDFKIRKLEKKDLTNGLLETLSNLFPVVLTPAKAERIFDEISANPAYHIFVAEHEDNIVGAITLLVERKFILQGATFGYLEDLAVHKDFEGRALGKLLIDAAITEARRQDCRVVRLDCNDSVARLYEACGFHKKVTVNRMQINLAPDL